ncbi:hypothetical protein Hanom_Chr16g01489711 [Helianthus anomalus]
MPVRVPMFRAKQITTPAPKSGQTDSFPASRAPVHLLLHHHRFVPLNILQFFICHHKRRI